MITPSALMASKAAQSRRLNIRMQRNVREASCPKRQGDNAEAVSRGDPTGRTLSIGFNSAIAELKRCQCAGGVESRW